MNVIRWKPNSILLLICSAMVILLLWKFLSFVSHDSKADDDRPIHTSLVKRTGRHKLAVIVPFRNRFEELLEFVPHIHSFLKNALIDHRILVVNQADMLRFNRASLINIGYILSETDCDYLAMHDVDLLPLNPALDYGYPDGYVFHVSAPNLHPLYHYKKFVGGILLLTHKDFKTLNGLSNRYWGWGREDDEFYVRMTQANIQLKRPSEDKVKTGYQTFRHIHDRVKRPRDMKRTGEQKISGNKRDYNTGLSNVDYKLTESYNLTINQAPVTVYNVELNCDRSDTPWCENLS